MATDSGDPRPIADAMTTATSSHGKATVLAVAGTVDLATAKALEEAVGKAVASDPTALIVDLTEVEFLASAGMAILVETHRRVGDKAAFAVVADGPATSRPIELTGLDKVFPLYRTLPEALDGVA
jgi:anti-anti-sigma factor